jgi:hypothetical protein
MKTNIRIERLVSFGNYENVKIGAEIEIDRKVTGEEVRRLADQVEEWCQLHKKRTKLTEELHYVEAEIRGFEGVMKNPPPTGLIDPKGYAKTLKQARAHLKVLIKEIAANTKAW